MPYSLLENFVSNKAISLLDFEAKYKVNINYGGNKYDKRCI